MWPGNVASHIIDASVVGNGSVDSAGADADADGNV